MALRKKIEQKIGEEENGVVLGWSQRCSRSVLMRERAKPKSLSWRAREGSRLGSDWGR